ncbi:MAG: ABC transporter substrate-binding protein [Pseudomonadota bacterium]
MPHRPLTLLLLLVTVIGCGDAPPAARVSHDGRPMRIVSLDLCADQYVLKFVERERILAVSPVATAEFSYMRDAARGVPVVQPNAEDVLVLKPDLVVRAYGGGANATTFFERAGVPVLTIGWAADIAAVMSMVQSIASGLGEPEAGAAVVAEMQQRLAQLPDIESASALYMTPSGVTTGPGSLVHDILIASGVENFQNQPGWQPIPLEKLAYNRPDMIAAAFFDAYTNHPDAWSPMRHPVARAQLRERPTVQIKGAWTSCSGWYLMDAVEALSRGAAL